MRWTVPLLAVALVGAACSDDDDDQSGSDASASEATEPTATNTEVPATTAPTATTADAADTTAPAGGNMIEVGELGVQFEAPEGWTPVDPAEVGDLADENVLAELAESTGVSTEALANTLTEQVELFVFSGESDGEIAPNINAIEIPVEALPSADQIQADFERLGAANVEIESTDAGGDDAVVVRYQLPLSDDRVAEGYGLFIDVGDEVVNLTVTTLDRAEADEVGELMRSTVSTAG